MEALSDQELLLELMRGSHEAFSVIYKKYWKKVFVFAHDRLKDVRQSQDIVQDIFVSLWERKEALKIDNLNAYLYASVRYSVLKLIETQQVKDHFFLSLGLLDAQSSPADNAVISSQLMEAYRVLIDSMPKQRRKIFEMRHEQNMKTREIAEILNISQKTVQNQLHSSYQEIRTLLSRVLLFTIMCFLIS